MANNRDELIKAPENKKPGETWVSVGLKWLLISKVKSKNNNKGVPKGKTWWRAKRQS